MLQIFSQNQLGLSRFENSEVVGFRFLIVVSLMVSFLPKPKLQKRANISSTITKIIMVGGFVRGIASW